MDSKLYTQEGKEYKIKTLTASNALVGPMSNIAKVVSVNVDSVTYPAINLNTIKPIIPISYSMSVFDPATGSVVDVSNCYFYIQSALSAMVIPKYYQTISKIYPYVQRIYYTDANNNNFIVRYNQLIFSDTDFIETNDPLLIVFSAILSGAYTQQLHGDFITVGAGNYSSTVTFTYLELQ